MSIDELRLRVQVLEIELRFMRINQPGRSTHIRSIRDLKERIRKLTGNFQKELF